MPNRLFTHLLTLSALLLALAGGLKATDIVIWNDTVQLNIVVHSSPFAILSSDTRGIALADVYSPFPTNKLGSVAIGAIGVPAPNELLYAENLPAQTEQEVVDLQYNAMVVDPFDPSKPIYARVPAFVTPFMGSTITDPALLPLLGLETYTFQFISGTPVAPDGTQTLTFDLQTITQDISSATTPEPSSAPVLAGLGLLAAAGGAFSRRRHANLR